MLLTSVWNDKIGLGLLGCILGVAVLIALSNLLLQADHLLV